MTTKSPAGNTGGALLSPHHVITDHDAPILTRRGRQHQVVPWEAVTAEKGNGSGTVIKEISDLLAKYGPWGSVVCAPDGSVIANADYALACKLMRVPVLAYVVPDVQVPDLVRAFAVDYGEYCFDPLDTTTYAQAHAQLNRLRGERDTDGKLLPHSGDTESQIYRFLVGPHLEAVAPAKPRMIDFGCGHADHAKRLQKTDYPIIAYEPHSRIPGRDAFDVRHIASTVAKIGNDVRKHGLFDVVILDSVLNSVISLEWEDAVLTTVNALCAADGVMFTNCRGLKYIQNQATSKKDSSGAKRIEFLDADNFSAVYMVGKWVMQHYHSKADFVELLGRYFEDVTIDHYKEGSRAYHRTVCRRPRPLGAEKYKWALNLELNMELPGGFHHSKQRPAVDALLAALAERDAPYVIPRDISHI